jgi:hypothetical protein
MLLMIQLKLIPTSETSAASNKAKALVNYLLAFTFFSIIFLAASTNPHLLKLPSKVLKLLYLD